MNIRDLTRMRRSKLLQPFASALGSVRVVFRSALKAPPSIPSFFKPTQRDRHDAETDPRFRPGQRSKIIELYCLTIQLISLLPTSSKHPIWCSGSSKLIRRDPQSLVSDGLIRHSVSARLRQHSFDYAGDGGSIPSVGDSFWPPHEC